MKVNYQALKQARKQVVEIDELEYGFSSKTLNQPHVNCDYGLLARAFQAIQSDRSLPGSRHLFVSQSGKARWQ